MGDALAFSGTARHNPFRFALWGELQSSSEDFYTSVTDTQCRGLGYHVDGLK